MRAAPASTPENAAPASVAQAEVHHLQLWLLRCTLWLVQRAGLTLGPLEQLLTRFPALVPFLDAAAAAGLEGLTLAAAIRKLDLHLGAVGARAERLPLQRMLTALSFDADDLCCFLACVLSDEEPQLSPLFDALRGHDGRATRATLADTERAASVLATLLAAGYLCEERVSRFCVYTVPPAVAHALRGLTPPDWSLTELASLPALSDLILPSALQAQARQMARTPNRDAACWVLRGNPGSGKRALAGAMARETGRALLEPASDHAPAPSLATLPALCTLLCALPLLTIAPKEGERASLPALPGYRGPVAVRLPAQGGLHAGQRIVRWLELTMPEPEERRLHWCRVLGRADVGHDLLDLRIARGSIHGIAANLPADAPVTAEAVMAELELQGRFRLEGLAQRVAALGKHEELALSDAQQEEFAALLARCRHREALRALVPAAFGHTGSAGVRALFKGPSGTGKTLAARKLAATLARPLYRVDLAATVSKYIGETERNLERVFAAAETLDIVLLLDEGDALLGSRTNVSNANDRYANLETNFLLQRLESYDGILIVTSNAAERIDQAFARRMDATLNFALPDARTRQRLWHAHLPHQHAVDALLLDEVAQRCALSGGQIRGAALHATLLGLEDRCTPGARELLAALRREYRVAGQSCPSLSRG